MKSVAIIGGGTAGWLVASVVAAKHRRAIANRQLSISLVESSDIPTIGVGEGTWPTMKNTLYDIGLKERDVFKHCHAAFKQGGKFVNWVHGNGDFYYHPFTFPVGYGRIDIAPYLQNIASFATECNFQQQVCEAGLAPRSAVEKEYQGDCNYAYHLDAGAFGDLLKKYCKNSLGVQHVIATVNDVLLQENGAIKTVKFTNGNSIVADLFIDCTGFQSLLLGKAMQVAFNNTDDTLFNDRALAVQIPYANPNQPIASHTIATAQNAGWIWDIGLTHRRGVGHVYSSQFLSDDQAYQNLQSYLNVTSDIDARKIQFNSGYRQTFWQQNCVAVGLSAGFVEPLEATAIMLVELSARFIAENLNLDQGVMQVVAKRFNKQMHYRWSRIIDFLKLHYCLTKRPEPYWQHHTNPKYIPQTLQDDLTVWQTRGPTIADFESTIELFPAASYQYVLYGMGFQPDFASNRYLYPNEQQSKAIVSKNSLLTKQYLQTLPAHRQFIEQWLTA